MSRMSLVLSSLEPQALDQIARQGFANAKSEMYLENELYFANEFYQNTRVC
jgi:hypothetical protein